MRHNEATSGGPLRMVCLYFMPELVFRPGGNEFDFEYIRPFYAQGEAFVNRLPRACEANRAAVTELRNLHELVDRPELHFKLRAKSRLLRLLSILADHYAGTTGDSGYDNESIQLMNRIKPAVALAQMCHHRKLSLTEAASAAHMSTSYFCKVFKRATGTTFHEYVLRVRIDRAKELLLRNDKTVTEILYAVGFENSSHFYREFKRLTNLTPVEYRNRAV